MKIIIAIILAMGCASVAYSQVLGYSDKEDLGNGLVKVRVKIVMVLWIKMIMS